MKKTIESDKIGVVVQINGKLQYRFHTSSDVNDSMIRSMALADWKIKKHIGNKTPKKIVVIRKNQILVNIVI